MRTYKTGGMVRYDNLCTICGQPATAKHVCAHLDQQSHIEAHAEQARAKRRAHLIEEIIIHNPCVTDEECLAAVEQIMRLQDAQ
jgi:hypothetical protein